jgi:uncharacterized membrane protein YbhN (UPF0104 family)
MRRWLSANYGADRMEDSGHAGEADRPADDDVGTDRRSVRKIVVRVLVMVVGLGVAGFVLASVFDDLDPAEIGDAIRALDDAEIVSLIFGTVFVVFAESLLTATFVSGLPARRGALAWLGPMAIASIVPGPSDMPVRYRMLQSWGTSPTLAATAVGAASVFNIFGKLILPAVAGVGVAVGNIPLEGVASTIVSATVILALLVVVAVVVLGSEARTAAAGRVLDRIWRGTMRILRRGVDGPALADVLVERRAEAIDSLRGRWLRASAAMLLMTASRVALFVMCIRFAGVPEAAMSWQAMFCVWAIVLGLTVIPIMPGNAGVSELAYVGMLTPIAGSQYVNQVTAGVMLFRILTWLLMIPTGFAALGLWKLGLRRSAEQAAAGTT